MDQPCIGGRFIHQIGKSPDIMAKSRLALPGNGAGVTGGLDGGLNAEAASPPFPRFASLSPGWAGWLYAASASIYSLAGLATRRRPCPAEATCPLPSRICSAARTVSRETPSSVDNRLIAGQASRPVSFTDACADVNGRLFGEEGASQGFHDFRFQISADLPDRTDGFSGFEYGGE